MYSIILCDDNEDYIDYLKEIVLKTNIDDKEVEFLEFVDGENLVEYLKKPEAKCDLLLLDMQLPGMDGDAVAEQFRRRFSDTILVFCSGKRPTDKTIKVMPYRYLYKEYTDEKMLDEMQEIIDKVVSHKVMPVIIAHSYNKHIQLKPDEILYIEIARRGCKVKVCPFVNSKDMEGDLITNEKLPDLFDRLKDFGFMYAHNSYIVNLKYVKKILSNELEFIRWENQTTAEKLSVSRARMKELKRAFARELGNKY